MSSKWDDGLKRLVKANPQHIVSWLRPGARFIRQLSGELHSRNIRADTVFEVVVEEYPQLIHIEFQSYAESGMDERLWEYNVLATLESKQVVESYVIYLKKTDDVVESPLLKSLSGGREVHRFYFNVVKLWEVPQELFKREGLVGLLPLLPLAQPAARLESVEEAIVGILSDSEDATKRELLALTYGLAALVFEGDIERDWLRRRFQKLGDILRETWAFQELIQEGRVEGLKEGLKEGMREGMKEGMKEGIKEGRIEGLMQELQRLRRRLLGIVQAHAPELSDMVQKRADVIGDPEVLQDLIIEVSTARTKDEINQLFLAKDEEK